ncbi:MAG: LppP/LprE family lipoprotein [Pyrinomonadaceae bacterium]
MINPSNKLLKNMSTPAALIVVFAIVLFAASNSFSQGAWLDAKKVVNWNKASAAVPTTKTDKSQLSQCGGDGVRSPTLAVDKLLTAKGWLLVDAAQVWGDVTVVMAASGFDGMCRPEGYNVFVFVGTKFAGTLSPKPMGARSDGGLVMANLNSAASVYAEYSRFSDSDALCCPSRTSSMSFEIKKGLVVPAGEVSTIPNPQ